MSTRNRDSPCPWQQETKTHLAHVNNNITETYTCHKKQRLTLPMSTRNRDSPCPCQQETETHLAHVNKNRGMGGWGHAVYTLAVRHMLRWGTLENNPIVLSTIDPLDRIPPTPLIRAGSAMFTHICRQRWSATPQKLSAGKCFLERYQLIHNALSSIWWLFNPCELIYGKCVLCSQRINILGPEFCLSLPSSFFKDATCIVFQSLYKCDITESITI